MTKTNQHKVCLCMYIKVRFLVNVRSYGQITIMKGKMSTYNHVKLKTLVIGRLNNKIEQ